MITFHASAVCRVRDGYTGRILHSSALLCTLDGAPVRPLAKTDGILVLLDLTPGRHRLTLRAAGYQEEWVDITASREQTPELEITMKPGEGYPFRGATTRLELTVIAGDLPAAGRQLWLAAPTGPELKVAQTKAEAGTDRFRLYCKGPEAAVPSGAYLIADGAESEIVFLRSLEEEMGTLAAPLLRDHGRSRSLLPAQRYHTGADGRITAVLQTACTLEVYDEERGLLASLPMEQGENRRTISL